MTSQTNGNELLLVRTAVTLHAVVSGIGEAQVCASLILRHETSLEVTVWTVILYATDDEIILSALHGASFLLCGRHQKMPWVFAATVPVSLKL